MDIVIALALGVVVLTIAGILYQSVGLRRDARRFPPAGRLVDVDGHRLHVVSLGQGEPVVFLESAIAASSVSWARVQPEVAQFTRVCAHDRAGLAWSDAAPEPRTITRMCDEIQRLLATIGGSGPTVLVGHSFGALLCLAYTARAPSLVSGLVLVDPPSEWAHMDRQRTQLLRGAMHLSRIGAVLARLGVVRACLALLTGGAPAAPRYLVKLFGPTTARTLERLVGEVRKLPPELHAVVQALWCQPKCFLAMAAYLRALPEAIVDAERLPPLTVPLVVISSGDQPPDVLDLHQALARKSSMGRHVVARRSTHWIPFDEPALIVDAIREVIQAGSCSTRERESR
jgi:pimeloyl-ACP methyl ester carboxylesterase